MWETQRALAPGGILVLAVLSGDPEKGLPHVGLFNEASFDATTRGISWVEKRE